MKKLLFSLLITIGTLSYVKAQITIDGNVSEWDNIPILSEPGVFPMVKTVSDGTTNLSFMIKLDGETFNPSAWYMADMYLDADNNATTGYKQWVYESSGMDYLSQGTDLFNFSGTGGTNSWSWSSIGTVSRAVSGDASSIEQSVLLSNLTSPSLGTTYAIAMPYYNSAWTAGDPTFLPLNNWNFAQRRGFTVKPRSEITLSTSADFTSADAYYHPFMKDDVALDFQSGAYAADNPTHWASWALNLTTPGIYSVKMVSSGTGSGKFQLSLVNMATNSLVKTFAEDWYLADATMTENTYNSIDLSDVPSGKYMLKLTNPTTWDTFLKVEKIALSQVPTSTDNQDFNHYVSVEVLKKSLVINTIKEADISIYSVDGKMIAHYNQTRSIDKNLNSGVYIISIEIDGIKSNKKLLIK